MARQDNNKILYDELVKIGADEKTDETFVMYLTQKERDDSLLAQIKYCGSFDRFFDKTSLMNIISLESHLISLYFKMVQPQDIVITPSLIIFSKGVLCFRY